jgi:hypothetical protein
MKAKRCLLLRVVPMMALLLHACADGGGWTVAAVPDTWHFRGFREDQDLSGLAAWDDRHVLVVTDETVTVQSGIMDRAARTVTAGSEIPLPLPVAGDKTEADAEGVAVLREDGAYYVTGSHGLGKKKADFQPSRCQVYRIPVDAATGEPMAAGITAASLLPWVEQHPDLAAHVRQPLQLNGFNIEGLAARDGRLWFGLRAPNRNGVAFVIEADPAGLFSGKMDGAVLHRIPVGQGLGIRELAALRDGFLVLTGNASAEATRKQPTTMAPGEDQKFALWFWRPSGPGSYSVKIGELPEPSAKAEGLLILRDEGNRIDVLVLFDSAAGGGPKQYAVTRPAER